MDEQLQIYKGAIEALLFVSEKPVVLDQLKEVFPELKPSQIHDLIKELQEEYVNRHAGMVVVEIAGGFQMLSNSHAGAIYQGNFIRPKQKKNFHGRRWKVWRSLLINNRREGLRLRSSVGSIPTALLPICSIRDLSK